MAWQTTFSCFSMNYRYFFILEGNSSFWFLILSKCFSIDFISLLEKHSITFGLSRQSWNSGRMKGSAWTLWWDSFRDNLLELVFDKNFPTLSLFFRVNSVCILFFPIFSLVAILNAEVGSQNLSNFLNRNPQTRVRLLLRHFRFQWWGFQSSFQQGWKTPSENRWVFCAGRTKRREFSWRSWAGTVEWCPVNFSPAQSWPVADSTDSKIWGRIK